MNGARDMMDVPIRHGSRVALISPARDGVVIEARGIVGWVDARTRDVFWVDDDGRSHVSHPSALKVLRHPVATGGPAHGGNGR